MAIIAAIAAGLFITLAVVDWALSRLEPERETNGRAVGFAAAGLVCLVGAGVLAWAARGPAIPAAAPWVERPSTSSVEEDLAQLEQLVKESLSLAQKVADGTFEPELPTILDARRRLQATRLSLSDHTYPTSAASTLRSQSDILLGAAYHTLGIQWILVKLHKWEQTSERDTATGPLQRELTKWYTIRDCLKAGRDDCGAKRSADPKHVAITDFIGWLHPYLVEFSRFQESDTDLVVGTPEEIDRLRKLFSSARQELTAVKREAWDRDLVKATDALLAAADTALAQEDAERSRQAWTIEEMQRTNAPVISAFEQVMMAVMEAR